LDPTAYKVVARLIRATESGLPSDRHADRIECAAVLRAVKVWPGKGRARGKVGATANLDSSCARRLCNTAGRGEETGFQVEQRNRSRKQEREIAALKPLDNKDPIQGHSEAERFGVPHFLATQYLRTKGIKPQFPNGIVSSVAFVSTTNTASLAGFVLLALALTPWRSPGSSEKLSPAL